MQILRGHHDRVRGLAYSPDGASLASCGGDGTLRIWDLAGGGEPRVKVMDPNRALNAVAIAPDGGSIAVGGYNSNLLVLIWKNLNVAKLEYPRGLVTSLAYSPDGAFLLVGSGNTRGTATRIDLFSPLTPKIEEFEAGLWSVAYSPCGQFAALGFANSPGEIVLWSFEGADPLDRLPVHSRVRSLVFSPDGLRLAAAIEKRIGIYLLDSASVRPDLILDGHTANIYSLAVSPDGGTLASAAHDGVVRLWDIATGAETNRFDWGVGKLESVAFSPDGTSLAAGGHTGIAVIDLDGLLS